MQGEGGEPATKQDTRVRATDAEILAAIRGGVSKQSRLAAVFGFSRNGIKKRLRSMARRGLIEIDSAGEGFGLIIREREQQYEHATDGMGNG